MSIPIPTTLTKGTGLRWPVVRLTATTKDGRHMCLEEFLIDVAKRIGMPGYGEKGIPDAQGKYWPLNRREDWYLKATANLATTAGVGDDVVPPASEEEIAIGDLAPFRKEFAASLKPEEWPEVLGVMMRGGRFEPASGARADGKLAIASPRPCISTPRRPPPPATA